MSYKFYSFSWTKFSKGEPVSHADGVYCTLGGYPKVECFKQQIRDQFKDQSAEIMIRNIRPIRKAKYELLKAKPLEPSVSGS
jgi:hypothetical protein